VNLQFAVDYIASFSNWINARIDAHVASATNPHGTTLAQSEIVTALINYAGGNIVPGATGTTIIGTLADTCLTFLATGTLTPDYQIRYDSTSGYLDLEVILATKTIRIDPYGVGAVDFGGMALTNYASQTDPDIQFYEASATPNLYLGYASATTLLSAVVPASFSAGYYAVDVRALLDNSDGSSANIGQIYLLTSGTTIQQTLSHGFASSSHSYDVAEVTGRRILYLSPAQLVQITGVTLLPPATNPIRGSRVYLSMVYLGATRKAY